MKKIIGSILMAAMFASVPVFAQKETEKTTILLAAAASLKNAFDKELIPLFQKKNKGIIVEATYDSSGKLQVQIEQGLPAGVFMSAAVTQMNALVKSGYVDGSKVTPLLQNRLVLIRGSKGKTAVKDFKSIGAAQTIAIGDPKSVPAGQYAEEALRTLGVWNSLPTAKTSLGTNVTEVLNWVAQGSAEVGIVYATDAASRPKEVTVVAQLPDGVLSAPVIYPLAPVATSAHPAEAEAFVKFLCSPEAIAIFKKYGFSANN
jgi:molybdate transport system substrate-binding protein